jgi:hypothetical protein
MDWKEKAKKDRQRQGILASLVSAGFVLLGVVLRDQIPWYATVFFAVCLIVGVISIFVEPPKSKPWEKLVIDDTGITRIGRKLREHVAWADIERVSIMTTDEGPWLEDVYFIIDSKTGGGCAVAHDLATESKLLEALQSRLEGLDNAAVIEAMLSTSNREFPIWQAKKGA